MNLPPVRRILLIGDSRRFARTLSSEPALHGVSIENTAGAADTLEASTVGYSTAGVNVPPGVIGYPIDITAHGNSGADRLVGGLGNDTLNGGGGNDRSRGGFGNSGGRW